MKRNATRRRALATLAITSAATAVPKLALASWWNMARKPIRSFGRIYDYLKDIDLRLEEIGKKRVTIENAEFAGEEFINSYWGFYDFVNCHFSATHNITLIQLAECTFTECEFGPSRDDDTINFGKSRDSVFNRCRFNRANISLTKGNARFEQCECNNPNPDKNHGYFLSGPDLTLLECKAQNYGWIADNKLAIRNCIFTGAGGELLDGHLRNNAPIVAEFTLTDSTFEDAEEILWGTKLKNLTISRCVAKGVFRTQGLVVEDTAVIEDLSRGFFDLGWTSIKGKLHVRNCIFSDKGKPPEREKIETDCSFICAGTVPVETIIEHVTCRSEAACNLTSAHDGQKFNLSKPTHKNEIFIVRNCKIPYLKINWLKTKLLRLEDCEIDQLEIRNGQIGRLEVKGTKPDRLDISYTHADEYSIEQSATGIIIDHGSNYDKVSGKAKKK